MVTKDAKCTELARQPPPPNVLCHPALTRLPDPPTPVETILLNHLLKQPEQAHLSMKGWRRRRAGSSSASGFDDSTVVLAMPIHCRTPTNPPRSIRCRHVGTSLSMAYI
jgi:hypothetical protein